MNELLYGYYETQLLAINRGNHCGVPINAKPLYFITIFDQIGCGNELLDNKIYFSDRLNSAYLKTSRFLQQDITPTPFFKPYYYSKNEPFYHLKFKDGAILGQPSAKFIRENVEYAYLDNALWDLLQDAQVRGRLRDALMSHFLSR